MGFVHRDLKPENIVLDLNPLKVVLIDFNHSYSVSTMTKGHICGTPGYFPLRSEWRDGSKKWDVYSLVCIILEYFVGEEKYKNVNNEKDIKKIATELIKLKETPKLIKELLDKTILTKGGAK